LSFENRSELEIMNRSSLLTFKTITLIDCDTQRFGVKRNWTMNKLFANRTIERTVNLRNNPTSASSELVFIENTLEYGLFQVTFIVDVSFNENDHVNNSIDTLVEIVPTGFIVATLPDGMDQVKIGSSQNLTLDPISFSYDLDEVVNSSSLTYKFFCRVVQIISSFVDEIEQKNFTTDLMIYKKDSTLSMNQSIDCFDSSGKFHITFDFNRRDYI
jgi:hypothetical protein